MTNAVLDKETFCRLVEEHQSALYRTARSILSNQQDAEDAVQEAVCAAEYLTTPEPDLAEHLTLWDAVLQLPEPMRAAVTLFYYEDCSVAETAQILKISQGAVKTRLSRARDRLRQTFTEN